LPCFTFHRQTGWHPHPPASPPTRPKGPALRSCSASPTRRGALPPPHSGRCRAFRTACRN
jgi:hypothetical protein